ncbi:fungal specific transcription factor domain containing protein [Metarhizium acridum CQMa 102]|uniref:Fungal specific transcription factor domain containing protein n=1 Tax=Metarhizium acridum (strain CQMa 102) TaxID=655827 RepID=E9DRJ4_METAQ|nr:fungal specific transcription factor domain containing protein [Metarhizium acridum CQMa 102]EFY93872.1 fungal specific transcription factor domain containing protein [Metarhizium acridum CQMa 102]
MDTCFPSCLYPDDQEAALLCAKIDFCLIFEWAQHRFAQLSRLSNQEILALDAELQTGYKSLTQETKRVGNAPQRFRFARELLKTRYYNARIILARSLILFVAHDLKRKTPELLPEQGHILDDCCSIAAEAIDSTAQYWSPNRIHVWHSSWYLFQACTVPLLSISIKRNMEQRQQQQVSSPLSDEVIAWQTSLAKALDTFTEMRPWMRTSDQSPDMVSALYEALTATGEVDGQTPSATEGSLDLFGWCNEQLTELDWGVFLGDESLARGM